MMRIVARVLALVLIAAMAPRAECSAGDGPVTVRGLAGRAVQLLSGGDIRGVAEMMHYPPKYTPEERTNDVASTEEGLDLIAREFGAISDPRVVTGEARFYEIGGSGGDVPYLSSLSPYFSTQVLYEAKFSKLGDGYLRVTVIQLTSKSQLEILGVYFGLPVANPKSRPAIKGIAQKQLVQMHVPVTREMERQIEQSLKPVRYPK